MAWSSAAVPPVSAPRVLRAPCLSATGCALGSLGCVAATALLRRRTREGVRLNAVMAGSSWQRQERGGKQGPEPAVVGAPDRVVLQQGRLDVQAWTDLAHIYCINLDRRPERWSFMQDQFRRMQMPVERFSAVDGQTLDVPAMAEAGIIAKEAMPRYFLPNEMKLFGTDLTDGGIGCALSHMFIWKDIIQRVGRGEASPNAPFLVIEDDCKFVEDFSPKLLRERLSHVPADWELVYLGGQDLLRRQHQYQVGPGVRRLYKGFRETTAYVINDAGAKVALEVCVPMHWQVDTHLNDESLREGLKQRRGTDQDFTMRPRGYCLWPPIVSQFREGFKTDVQKTEHD